MVGGEEGLLSSYTLQGVFWLSNNIFEEKTKRKQSLGNNKRNEIEYLKIKEFAKKSKYNCHRKKAKYSTKHWNSSRSKSQRIMSNQPKKNQVLAGKSENHEPQAHRIPRKQKNQKNVKFLKHKVRKVKKNVFNNFLD